jgi:hypothetical protein
MQLLFCGCVLRLLSLCSARAKVMQNIEASQLEMAELKAAEAAELAKVAQAEVAKAELEVKVRCRVAFPCAAFHTEHFAGVPDVPFLGTVRCLSFGPIEGNIMFSVTSACARRTGARQARPLSACTTH